jgi:hypothetical protein
MFFAIESFFVGLRIVYGVFLVPMAPLQSSLTCFLFEGRIPEDEDVHGDVSGVPAEVCRISITYLAADSAGSNAPKPHELALSSQSDCVLLNTLSTPIPALERAPSVEVVDPAVASPLHAATRQRRQVYEHNRH